MPVDYSTKIKRIFNNAYIEEQEIVDPNGPVQFNYAIFTGENEYCSNTLLGLGNTIDKTWLDASLGCKILRKILHIPLLEGEVPEKRTIRCQNKIIVKKEEVRCPEEAIVRMTFHKEYRGFRDVKKIYACAVCQEKIQKSRKFAEEFGILKRETILKNHLEKLEIKE